MPEQSLIQCTLHTSPQHFSQVDHQGLVVEESNHIAIKNETYLKCEKATGIPSSVLATRYLTKIFVFYCNSLIFNFTRLPCYLVLGYF